MPSLPGTEEPPLARTFKHIIYGPIASAESLARLMCSQTHEQASRLTKETYLTWEYLALLGHH